MLELLLATAEVSGLIKEGAAAGNMAISMRQQLQQAGVLQSLAAVMDALTADLRSEAAALGRMSGEEDLCSHLARLLDNAQLNIDVRIFVLLHYYLMRLWSSPDQTATANGSAWLCDPSGHAEAAMQLCTAALQHVSSVLQHVLPAVQERAPQQADALLEDQQGRVEAAVKLGCDLGTTLFLSRVPAAAATSSRRGQSSTTSALDAQGQQRLQRLLLSPDCLPFIASMLVLTTSRAVKACRLQEGSGSEGPQGSSAGSSSSRSNRGSRGSGSSSSSRGHGSGNGTRQQGRQQQQQQTAGGGSSSGMAGVAVGSSTPTPCQLQLLQLLGLAPQLTATEAQVADASEALADLSATLEACALYYRTLRAEDSTSAAPGQQQAEVDKQRWRFEQQLWLLLPSVLLPCTNSLLLLADIPADPRMADACESLMNNINCALFVPSRLQKWLGRGASEYRPPHPAWMGEVLGGVLQLADQLRLLQPPPQAEPPAQAAAVPGNSQGGSSRTPTAAPAASNTCCALQGLTRARCAIELTQMLSQLVRESSRWFLSSGSSTASPWHEPSSDSTSSTDGDAAAVPATASRPLVAARFVEVCAAFEAGLRAITAALQSSTLRRLAAPVSAFLLEPITSGSVAGRSPLPLHMGLCGPEAAVQEQRQFFSLLSTLQKLSHCRAGATQELCWGQQNSCCWRVADSAIWLLEAAPLGVGSAAAGSGATATAAAGQQAQSQATAVLQQPELECLPSLVIFGRCCMAWAGQLHQQTPEVLQLLASSTEVQQQQEQGGARAEHSAARVCIPGWQQQGAAAATTPPCGLEGLVAAVLSWVGGVTCPAAHTALAAAAGGDLQQFRQQLEALSAAQAAVRQEGVSAASLAALVQQLRASGAMSSGIAVPHFCNNPACVNISGPTDVLLVSGRSCLCAGCRTARYCGRDCQRQAWPRHKPVCKALAAAAATAGGD